jgi:hypothetical protein
MSSSSLIDKKGQFDYPVLFAGLLKLRMFFFQSDISIEFHLSSTTKPKSEQQLEPE